MTKSSFTCPIFGCLEEFNKKCHLTNHLKHSCAIKKKLTKVRSNGSPLFRRPQKIQYESIEICEQTIGKGSYGEVYPAKLGSLQLIAKFIRRDPSLSIEKSVYEKLWANQIPGGIPRFYGIFDEVKGGAFLIIERLDYCLWDLLKDHTFNEQEKILFLLEMTKILEILHRKGEFIHRDIKENNIMFSEGIIYLIDFGLAVQKPRRDDDPSSKNSRGNLFYLDLRGHRGVWQDSTSDLQTIGFIVANLYLKKGLPWTQTYKDYKEKKISYDEANEKILDLKERFLKDRFEPLPHYLWDYFREVSFRQFACEVDYEKLIFGLQSALEKLPKHIPCWKNAKLLPILPNEQFMPIVNFQGMKLRFDLDDLTEEMRIHYANEYGIPGLQVCQTFLAVPEIKFATSFGKFDIVIGKNGWSASLKKMKDDNLEAKLFLFVERYDANLTGSLDQKRQPGEQHEYGLYLIYKNDIFSFVNSHDLSDIFLNIKKSKYWKNTLVSSSGYHCYFWTKEILRVGLVEWARYEE